VGSSRHQPWVPHPLPAGGVNDVVRSGACAQSRRTPRFNLG
jgi:hypothetical protein